MTRPILVALALVSSGCTDSSPEPAEVTSGASGSVSDQTGRDTVDAGTGVSGTSDTEPSSATSQGPSGSGDTGSSGDDGDPTGDLPPANCETSELELAAEALEPRQWIDFDTSGFSAELVDDGGPNVVFGYTWEAFWDPTTCRVLFIGGGHLSLTKFLSYRASDNEWEQVPDPHYLCPPQGNDGSTNWGCVGHAYGFQAMPEAGGAFYYRYGGRWYGIETDPSLSAEWEEIGQMPESLDAQYSSAAYVNGLERLVVVSNEQLGLLDPATGAWSYIDGPFAMGTYHWYGVFSPPSEVMLFGAGNGSTGLNALRTDGSTVPIADAPLQFHPASDASDGTFKVLTYDPLSGNFLAYAPSGVMYEYDVDDNGWSIVSDVLPQTRASAAVVSSYGVIMFIDPYDNRVWLYRHQAG